MAPHMVTDTMSPLNTMSNDIMLQEMYNSQLIPALLRNLARMEFEARKETAEIFKHVLRRQIGLYVREISFLGYYNS